MNSINIQFSLVLGGVLITRLEFPLMIALKRMHIGYRCWYHCGGVGVMCYMECVSRDWNICVMWKHRQKNVRWMILQAFCNFGLCMIE